MLKVLFIGGLFIWAESVRIKRFIIKRRVQKDYKDAMKIWNQEFGEC